MRSTAAVASTPARNVRVKSASGSPRSYAASKAAVPILTSPRSLPGSRVRGPPPITDAPGPAAPAAADGFGLEGAARLLVPPLLLPGRPDLRGAAVDAGEGLVLVVELRHGRPRALPALAARVGQDA